MPKQPELAELRPQLARKAVGAVDLGGVRRDLVLGKGRARCRAACRCRCRGRNRDRESCSGPSGAPWPRPHEAKGDKVAAGGRRCQRAEPAASLTAARPLAGRAATLSIASAGRGFANKKPCISSQPASRSSTRCSSVSTPSAKHFHAERMAERDDRLDDGAGMAGRAQRTDEGAVDLDLAERKFLQVAQARIAGAEIVERDAHAERAQRFEPLQGLLRVVDQNPFGHFEA